MYEQKGIYPVIPTPFDENGKIVWRDLDAIVDFAINCQVEGIVVHDFLGEFQYMTDEERMEVSRTVLKRAAGKIKIIIGVSAVSPLKILPFAVHAQEHGASAVLCAAPYLTAYPWNFTVSQGFLPLDQAVRIPIILHNAPEWQSGMNSAQIKDLAAQFQNQVYIKDDSTAIHTSITEILNSLKEISNFGGVFAGQGAFDMIHEWKRGACGFMLGLHLADQLELIWKDLEEGSIDSAEQRQFALSRIQLLERLYPIEVCKHTLKRRGVIEHTCSRMNGKPRLDKQGIEGLNRALDSLCSKASICL